MKNMSLLSLLSLAIVATGNLTAKKGTKDDRQDGRITEARREADKANRAVAALDTRVKAIEDKKMATEESVNAKIAALPKPVDNSAAIADMKAKIAALPKPVDNSAAIADMQAKIADKVAVGDLDARVSALQMIIDLKKSVSDLQTMVNNLKVAPVQLAPVQSAPVQSAPVQSAPVQSAPQTKRPVVQSTGD